MAYKPDGKLAAIVQKQYKPQWEGEEGIYCSCCCLHTITVSLGGQFSEKLPHNDRLLISISQSVWIPSHLIHMLSAISISLLVSRNNFGPWLLVAGQHGVTLDLLSFPWLSSCEMLRRLRFRAFGVVHFLHMKSNKIQSHQPCSIKFMHIFL